MTAVQGWGAAAYPVPPGGGLPPGPFSPASTTTSLAPYISWMGGSANNPGEANTVAGEICFNRIDATGQDRYNLLMRVQVGDVFSFLIGAQEYAGKVVEAPSLGDAELGTIFLKTTACMNREIRKGVFCLGPPLGGMPPRPETPTGSPASVEPELEPFEDLPDLSVFNGVTPQGHIDFGPPGAIQTKEEDTAWTDFHEITIVTARNLQDAFGRTTTANPYCVCEIPGKFRSKFYTAVVDGSLNPVWNQVAPLIEWARGDHLMFTVYDKELGSEDEVLGRAMLYASQFHPQGFKGRVPLQDCHAGVSAYLEIQITACAVALTPRTGKPWCSGLTPRGVYEHSPRRDAPQPRPAELTPVTPLQGPNAVQRRSLELTPVTALGELGATSGSSPSSPGSPPRKSTASAKLDLDPWEPGGCGVQSAANPDKHRSLHFSLKWRCRTLRLSPDQSSASWRKAECGGFALSAQPVQRNGHQRWFEVRVEEVDPSRWTDGLGVGLSLHPTIETSVKADRAGSFEGLAYEVLPKCWLLGYDGRAHLSGDARHLTAAEIPNGMWRPRELEAGDVVGLLATKDGVLMLFVNEVLKYKVAGCDWKWGDPLHVALDLDGCTKSVHLLDASQPSANVLGVLKAHREQTQYWQTFGHARHA